MSRGGGRMGQQQSGCAWPQQSIQPQGQMWVTQSPPLSQGIVDLDDWSSVMGMGSSSQGICTKMKEEEMSRCGWKGGTGKVSVSSTTLLLPNLWLSSLSDGWMVHQILLTSFTSICNLPLILSSWYNLPFCWVYFVFPNTMFPNPRHAYFFFFLINFSF